MTQLYRVAYCSCALFPDGPDAVAAGIQDILLASQRNNVRSGITGGLLFSGECFAQVLEGPVEPVVETFERIQCDRRHRDLTVLRAEPIARRGFPSWSTGFAGLDSGHALQRRFGPAQAACGPEQDGQAVFDLLRAVIAREDDRLRHA